MANHPYKPSDAWTQRTQLSRKVSRFSLERLRVSERLFPNKIAIHATAASVRPPLRFSLLSRSYSCQK
jgi:hypothetical protein